MSNILRMKTEEASEIQAHLDNFKNSGGKVEELPIVQSAKSGGTEAWFDMGESYMESVRRGKSRSSDVRRRL